jgi:hypothetical protein
LQDMCLTLQGRAFANSENPANTVFVKFEKQGKPSRRWGAKVAVGQSKEYWHKTNLRREVRI